MNILITGGAGFIGSAVVRKAVSTGHSVVNVDSLAYSANLKNVESVSNNPIIHLNGLIFGNERNLTLFLKRISLIVLYLAAESHVDRSIDGPSNFIETNIIGTFNILEASRSYWSSNFSPKISGFTM